MYIKCNLHKNQDYGDSKLTTKEPTRILTYAKLSMGKDYIKHGFVSTDYEIQGKN